MDCANFGARFLGFGIFAMFLGLMNYIVDVYAAFSLSVEASAHSMGWPYVSIILVLTKNTNTLL